MWRQAIFGALALSVASAAAAQTPTPPVKTQSPTNPPVFGPSPKGGPGGGFRTGLGRDIGEILKDAGSKERVLDRITKEPRIDAEARVRDRSAAANK